MNNVKTWWNNDITYTGIVSKKHTENNFKQQLPFIYWGRNPNEKLTILEG